MFESKQYKLKNLEERILFIEEGVQDSQAPTIVMLHGMFGGLGNFDAIIGPIAAHYPVFVPAMPLYDANFANLSVSKLGDWVAELIQRKCTGKVVLMGNSLGGHVALHIALNYPELVDALILTGSSGLKENHLGTTFPRRADRAYIRQKAELTFYNHTLDEQAIDSLLDITTSRTKLLRLLHLARDAHRYNMESQIHKIQIPVLLIWGKEDQITPAGVANLFYDKLPNAQLCWIEECGHAPMMEHPAQFSQLALFFLHSLYQPKQTAVSLN